MNLSAKEIDQQIQASKAAQLVIRRREAQKGLLSFTKYTFPEFEEARHHDMGKVNCLLAAFLHGIWGSILMTL